MKALLSFASAVADPVRLRLLALVRDRKRTTEELAAVLQQPLAHVIPQVKQLVDAGLFKAEKDGKFVRLKRKHHELIRTLFAHFAVSSKKDDTFLNDARLAKQLRDVKRAAGKEERKARHGKAKAAKQTKAPKRKAGSRD